jgi:hypothetical protein
MDWGYWQMRVGSVCGAYKGVFQGSSGNVLLTGASHFSMGLLFGTRLAVMPMNITKMAGLPIKPEASIIQ